MLANAPVQGYPLWQAVLAFHVVMWIVQVSVHLTVHLPLHHLLHLHPQFIGHGVFEGRAPALLDSWDQAFITAPLFVILEVLFFLGYRRQFYRDCMQEVEVELQKFRANKTK